MRVHQTMFHTHTSNRRDAYRRTMHFVLFISINFENFTPCFSYNVHGNFEFEWKTICGMERTEMQI